MTTITLKKIGNHWYFDVPHNNPSDLVLDTKIERVCNIVDKFEDGYLHLFIYPQDAIIIPEGLLQFTDRDLYRWLTTSEDFDMTIYISGHEFTINSRLITLLECLYNFNFHKETYRLELETDYEI